MTRQSNYTYDELIACANGDLFGPGNARLPAPPLLMFDRITHISDSGGAHDKGEIRAELDIKPELWFFDCHFRTDPVMPGCLGLDAMWQLVGFYLGWLGNPGRGRALGGRSEIYRTSVTGCEPGRIPARHTPRDDGQADHGHCQCAPAGGW